MPESDLGPEPIEIVYTSTNGEYGTIEQILVPPGFTVREPMGFMVSKIEVGPGERDFGVRIPVVEALGRGTCLDEAVREATQVVIDQAQYLAAIKGKPTPGFLGQAGKWLKRKIEYNPPPDQTP